MSCFLSNRLAILRTFSSVLLLLSPKLLAPFSSDRGDRTPTLEGACRGQSLHLRIQSAPLACCHWGNSQGSQLQTGTAFVVQSLSCVQLFATPCTAARQASLSITISRSLLKLMFIESVMPTSHFVLCHSLLLLPSVFPSLRVFSNEAALCISFSFGISPSSEYSGLISFRMDWLGLLVVQGTLKSILQYHSSKASILRHSAF